MLKGLQTGDNGDEPMLVVRDLHVKFHTRDREAVAGISFTIEDGEILGLVGESGSGKSVTAMSIAGLLPRRQCSCQGDILVDGRYVESLRNLTLIYRGSENQRVIDMNKTRAAGEIVLYKSDFDVEIVI